MSADPGRVSLWFSEAVDGRFSTAFVEDGAHQYVNAGDASLAPGDAREMDVPLPSQLPAGVYTVLWRAVSDSDGFILGGAYSFAIVRPGALVLKQSDAARPFLGWFDGPARVLLSLLAASCLLLLFLLVRGAAAEHTRRSLGRRSSYGKLERDVKRCAWGTWRGQAGYASSPLKGLMCGTWRGQASPLHLRWLCGTWRGQASPLHFQKEATGFDVTRILCWAVSVGVVVLMGLSLALVWGVPGIFSPTPTGTGPAPAPAPALQRETLSALGAFHAGMRTTDRRFVVTLDVEISHCCASTFRVSVRDARSGRLLAGGSAALFTSMLDMRMGSDSVGLRPEGEGFFSGQSDLSMGGLWQICVVIRTTDHSSHEACVKMLVPY